MRRLARTFALFAGLSLAASTAQGQNFSGSGCAGNTFQFCASWTGTLTDATHFQLFLTNTSGAAPANNLNTAFTQIAIGNLTVADAVAMGAVTGWQYDPNVNGFNGFGLLENQFGGITSNGINNALAAGQSQTFIFTLASALTNTQFNTAFAGVQIAIHDQGAVGDCVSSKGVLAGNTSGQNLYAGSCLTTTTPEPGTIVLLATGLVLTFGVARRRRAA